MDMKEKIEQIMENFDFEKVHKVMVALDWSSVRGDRRIPSVEVLKEEARELLFRAERLICEGGGTVTSFAGGFEAKYCSGYLSLSFIVEECLE
jgi:hypothetical protein